ncbi:hypothetical protein JM93_00573 [Roseibium hamelinense]|uniref:Response regulator receiver domain-containing protein n=1 Tax=Roseibium hamelinense TaxID=150831 RepID=A0A562TJP3_9HYPH|nr:hypothetical protein [Roseibium hamelinense]MTI45797.1 hypothetical protein [Roseibium hamelinense]TWI93020.1 hypothetical protein JM93_00573 [Roseibium hamelinense]
MDQDSSLIWQGPVWYVGERPPAFSVSGMSDRPGHINLAEGDVDPSAGLPSAIVADMPALAGAGDELTQKLEAALVTLPAEAPLIFLSDGRTPIPSRFKPHGILPQTVSQTALFDQVCKLQRALLRSEEARIRRVVFGRIPGYGAAPHYQGTSGFLVVGLGTRFLDLQAASSPKVDVIGAFSPGIAEIFMSQRAFDAVVLDGSLGDMLENLYQIRMDARFASLPVIAFADQWDDTAMLFKAGATDVLTSNVVEEDLKRRLSTAIRMGKRRRLADRMLAESHRWLLLQMLSGGVREDAYDHYLERAGKALALRGLKICEMKLLPERFSLRAETVMMANDLYTTLLSVADAASREEDLVCVVRDIGPVAVLKNERGRERLQARITSILGHTAL